MKKSIKEILEMDMTDLMKLSADETRDLLNIAASAANKRIQRLIKAPTTYGYKGKGANLASQSPAVRGLYKKLPSGKNVIRNFTSDKTQLGITGPGNAKGKYMKELGRAKRFLQAETSTAQGVRALARKVEGKGLKFETKSAESAFWKMYTKILTKYRNAIAKKGEEGRVMSTNQLATMLYQRVFKGQPGYKKNMEKTKVVMAEMEKIINDAYEKQQRLRNEEPDFSIKSESLSAKDIFGDYFDK